MARTSVAKNFVFNSLYQILRVLTPLVTTPYLARVLGGELMGEFSYTQSVAIYFTQFASLGIMKYGARAIATTTTREERTKVFWSVYFSLLVVAATVFVTYIAYLFMLSGDDLIWGIAWSSYVAAEMINISWLFFGVEDFKLTATRSIIIKFVQLVLIFTLVKSRDDFLIYLLLVAGEYFATQLSVWPFVKQHVDFYRPRWDEIRQHFLPNFKLFIPVIAVSLYNHLNSIMMGVMCTKLETAFYSYPYRIATLPLAIITALGTVMMPRMSSKIAENDEEGGLALIRKSLWIMLAFAFAFMWGIIGVANEFVPMFFGEEFLPCTPNVMVLAAVVPIISTTNVIGVQYLLPHFRDGDYTRSVIVGAVVNIIASFALISLVRSFGASLGTVIAEGAVMVAQMFMVKGDLPLKRYVFDAAPFLAIGAVMAAAIRFASPMIIAVAGSGVIGVLAEVLFGAVVYAVLAIGFCLITKNEIFEDLFVARIRRISA